MKRTYSDLLPKRHGLFSCIQQSPVSSIGSNEYHISMPTMNVKIVERENLQQEYARPAKPSSGGWGGKAQHKSKRSRSGRFSSGGLGGKAQHKSKRRRSGKFSRPYQYSCSHSSSYEVNDLSRCEAFFQAALSNEVNAITDVANYNIWSIKECIDDVQRIEGVSIQKVVTAGFAFVNKDLREVYTCFDAEARTWWVLNKI